MRSRAIYLSSCKTPPVHGGEEFNEHHEDKPGYVVSFQGVQHNGKHVEFAMSYSEEHEIMVPYEELVTSGEVPVTEDSALSEIIVEE